MAKTVSWTDAAWADLEAVADSIARDSRYYAAAFVREVREAARSLKPSRARHNRSRAWRPDHSRAICPDYRLLYHVTGRQVSILGFIHGARDLAALWKKEGPFRTT